MSDSLTFGAAYNSTDFGCRENWRDKPLPLSVRCRLKEMQTSNMAVSKHAESFVVGCFRSGTLNDIPAEMTASMGSSHHVFFSPRVQVNLHVAHHFDVVA